MAFPSAPLASDNRNGLVDTLRGWALFSVVVMNYVTIFHWNNHGKEIETDKFSQNLESLLDLLLGSKGWTLLAVLFGFGFSSLMENRIRGQQNTHGFFAKRMLWLFVFAFFNSIFFGGDILNDYAFLGLVMLMFYRLKTRSIFASGMLFLLLTPLLQSFLGNLHLLFAPDDRDLFYSLYGENNLYSSIKANLFMRYKWLMRLSYSIIFHLVQLGCMLLGMYLHRIGFFMNITFSKARRFFFSSLILSVLLQLFQMMNDVKGWGVEKFYHLFYPPIIAVMICTTSGLVWLYAAGKCKRIFFALQQTGRMTLTNYVVQNMIAFVIFIFMRLDWSLSYYLLASVVVFVCQLFFSKWWMQQFQYGLLEWLWRCFSYGRLFKLKF